MIRRIAPAAALLLAFAAAAAPARTLKFQHVTIEDGLSQGSVDCILQDRRGFLWFCSEDGLNRYDGRSMRVYKHRRDDPASISNNFTRHMIQDRTGAFWIATKSGLNRLDPDTGRFRVFRHDPADSATLSSDNVMRVLEAGDGGLWVGTWGGGLNRFDPATGTARRVALDDADLARGNIVNALHASPDGTVWAASVTGLFSLGPGEAAFTRHDLSGPGYDGPRDTIVIGIHEDPQGVLWLGSYTGLIRYDPRTGALRRFPLSPGDPKNVAANQVRAVIAAPDGEPGALWLATAGRGLAVFDRDAETLEFFTHDPHVRESLGHDALWCLFVDGAGTLWVGTDGGGADKLTPMASRFPHVADLPRSRSVWSFCEDPAGALWVGTSRGLVRQDPATGAWAPVPHRPGDPASIGDGTVNAMLVDGGGSLWFATATAGLSRLRDPAPPPDGVFRFETWRHDPGDPASLGGNRLLSLLEDDDGRIWVGTVDDGVSVLDPASGRFTHYRPDRSDPASLQDNSVECLYRDRSGVIWVGTLAGGLHRLDSPRGRFTRFAHDPAADTGLSNNHVTCLLEDDAGNLWIGTADGLDRLDPERRVLDSFSETDGLPNNYVYGLVADAEGRLWMGTNYGLSRLDPAAETFRNFTVRDGLQSNEFNAGAYYRSPRGELFFGGHNGFNRFFPQQVRDNPRPPPVVLTRCDVLGQPAVPGRAVETLESLTLSHRDYLCSFEFAALDYWAPELNRFRYRMEGLDADWIEAGTRNFASYTNLEPGRYVFRVQGANADGVWNEAGASLAIRVTPPFWQRAWFVGLCAIGIGLAGFGWHRYRVNRLLEMERLRTRISADLHDEIATNLSSIAMFSGMIQDRGLADESSRRLLERLRGLAEESVGSIRDIIWAIRPAPETLHGLLVRLQDRHVPACRGKGIGFACDLPAEADLPARNLAPEVRHHLWLLLKEALNNALKHAECTRLALSARHDGGRLRVTVEDDGRGFDPRGAHEGHGLNTMAMRARQLGGSFAVRSRPGEGTVVDLEVPV